MSKKNFIVAIDVLGADAARMRKELRVHKMEADRLSRLCGEYADKLSQLNNQLMDTNQSRAELMRQLTDKGNKVARLSDELNVAKDDLSDARTDAREWKNEANANYEEAHALSAYAKYLEIRVAAFHSLSADDSVFCADDMREVFNVSEIMKNHQLDREKEQENES